MGSAAEVEVEAEGLVDRQFHRRRPRPAAERQRNGEAGEADQKDGDENAGGKRLQHRSFEMARDVARAEAERGGEPESFGRDGEPALQEEPHRERQVEEDMRQNDAAEAVDGDPADAERGKPVVDDAGTAEDAEDAHHRDDHRQDEGRAEKRDQKRPAPESAAAPAPARPESPSARLSAAETAAWVTVNRRAAQSAGPSARDGRRRGRAPRQACRASARGPANRRPRAEPEPRAQRLSAVCHSTNAASRIAAASSGGIEKALFRPDQRFETLGQP